MKILHTEASPGWGGQELRILREAEGMRARGHEVILAVQKGGGLIQPARESGFIVYEVAFEKKRSLSIIWSLLRILKRHSIEIINTHSSLDAWIGGVIGKLSGKLVIRTRHLSTAVKRGINSLILYNWLADYVVTTCEETKERLLLQAKLSKNRCFSIPTGVDLKKIHYDPKEVMRFREKYKVKPEECLAGTLCILRGWKGISDLLQAAKLTQHIPYLKWIVVGSGVSEAHFKDEWRRFGLEDKVIFTGHLSMPFIALAAMDIFLLLSYANEGVSQASLQAAALKKPLITTAIGGLSEVCIHEKTGLQVPVNNSEAVAQAVLRLANNKDLRCQMGNKAKELVMEKFTLNHTLDQMEALYRA